MEMPVNCKDLKHLLTEASPHIDPWRLGWWAPSARLAQPCLSEGSGVCLIQPVI